MYEDYHGFVEKPFSLTPDPKYLFRSESHTGAFELLQYAIRRREGFAVITGDIGTGKTMLCRALLEQVDRQTFTALVLNPFLSEADLLKLILQDFGVLSRDEMKRGAASPSKQDLIAALYDFLLGLLPIHASAVVIIDEAQNLPLQVLEQIRILSNLETDKEKLLQIVLVGQTNLEPLLRSPELRQLDQRISIRYRLEPLTEEETAAYIAHRLTIAGGSMVTFTRRAVSLAHKASGGLPRLINLICDRALVAAYSVRSHRVMPDMIVSAIESLDLQTSPREPWSPRRLVAGLAATLATVGVAALGWNVSARARGTSAPPLPSASKPRPAADPAASEPASESLFADARSIQPLMPAGPRRLPEGAGYTVVVASYPIAGDTTSAEVADLTTRLEQAGLKVYYADVDLPTRGRWRRVLVGAFVQLDEAQRVETQLKQTAGLELARAVPLQLAAAVPKS